MTYYRALTTQIRVLYLRNESHLKFRIKMKIFYRIEMQNHQYNSLGVKEAIKSVVNHKKKKRKTILTGLQAKKMNS